MNTQDWSPLGWTGLISLQSNRLSRVRQHHSSKASIFWCSAFGMAQLSHPYTTTGKIIALSRQTFVGKVTSLLFDMLSRLVVVFLPRSKSLLIWWLWSQSAVILEPPKTKVCHCFHCFPIYLPWSYGTGCLIYLSSNSPLPSLSLLVNHNICFLCLWVYFCFTNKFICIFGLGSTPKYYHLIAVFLWLTSIHSLKRFILNTYWVLETLLRIVLGLSELCYDNRSTLKSQWMNTTKVWF